MDAKDEVKQRLSIEEVVGDYLELKRAGRNFKAKSPWTNEKTASLMVSPDKQIWHDFSSSKGGDIFSFVMEMDGVDFREALEQLARKAGVEIQKYASKGASRVAKQKQRMYEAHELAVKYYHATLAKNKTALDYVVTKRGYGKKIITDFELGYSPSTGKALVAFLTKKGFTTDELVQAGLAVRRRGISDMFRGRIMVPLHDGAGRPIGFTARALGDEMPKYLNTPSTMIYDKSRHVYGLHLAKDGIRKHGFVLLGEGNLDVVASHKTSMTNIVASAGTAMTKNHLVQLSRLTDDIRLCFDADRAGIAATERAIELAQELGIAVSVIELPEGQDPDDLIGEDPAKWEALAEQNVYAIDWLIKQYAAQVDLSSSQGKRQLSDVALSLVARLQDPVEQDHYVQQLADLLGSTPQAITQKMQNIAKAKAAKTKAAQARKRSNSATKTKENSGQRRNTTTTAKAAQPDATASAEQGSTSSPAAADSKNKANYIDELLGLALVYPSTRQSLAKLQKGHLQTEQQQRLFTLLSALGETQAVTTVPKQLRDLENYVNIILFKTEELYASWSDSDRLIEAIGLSRRLLRDYNQNRKQKLTAAIQAAEAAGDSARAKELLQQFHQLLKE